MWNVTSATVSIAGIIVKLHGLHGPLGGLPPVAISVRTTGMIKNLPVRSLVHKGMTIEGYSRAAVQSYWRIPELKIAFVLGCSPWSFMGIQTIFLSPAHLDHLPPLPVSLPPLPSLTLNPPTPHPP